MYLYLYINKELIIYCYTFVYSDEYKGEANGVTINQLYYL